MGLLITILLCLVNIFNVINNNSPSVKVSYKKSQHDWIGLGKSNQTSKRTKCSIDYRVGSPEKLKHAFVL